MPEVSAGSKRRRGRWGGTTAEQRRAATEKMRVARAANVIDRRIAELVEKAPPLTAEQCARLSALLNQGQDHTADADFSSRPTEGAA